MRIDWIVLKYDEEPNKMLCERCGARALAPMPCKLDDAQEIFKTFIRLHKKCKITAEKGEGGKGK